MQTPTSLEQVANELKELRQVVSALNDKIDALISNSSHAAMATEHLHIYSSPEMHQGEPTILGSSITVRAIIEQSRVSGSVEEIFQAYPSLSPAQVYDALAYYYDHTVEIENYIRENQEALWRLTNHTST